MSRTTTVASPDRLDSISVAGSREKTQASASRVGSPSVDDPDVIPVFRDNPAKYLGLTAFLAVCLLAWLVALVGGLVVVTWI
jgi:hypothetical protein